MEVGVRECLLSLEEREQVILRGLVFTRAMSYVTLGAIRLKKARHVYFDNCRVLWNNGDGISLHECENVTLRHVEASHNGMCGISIGQGKDFLCEDVVTNDNNWRGAMGQFTYWATAGMKACRLHRSTIRRFTSMGNMSVGLWLDWDIRDVVIDCLQAKHNSHDGLLVEACQGPVTVRNSTLQRNYVGVFLAWAARVTIEHCEISGNYAQQISIAGDRLYARTVEDWETDEVYAAAPDDCVLSLNIIKAMLPGQSLFGVRFGDIASLQYFIESLVENGNNYYHPNFAGGEIDGDDNHRYCG